MASVVASPFSITDSARQALQVFVQKSHDACFIDWVIGSVFGYVFVVAPALHWQAADPSVLWPAVAALGVTRFGDAIKKVVRDYSRAKYVEVQHGPTK